MPTTCSESKKSSSVMHCSEYIKYCDSRNEESPLAVSSRGPWQVIENTSMSSPSSPLPAAEPKATVTTDKEAKQFPSVNTSASASSSTTNKGSTIYSKDIRVGGRWRLGRRIGSGSFGDIYIGKLDHRIFGSCGDVDLIDALLTKKCIFCYVLGINITTGEDVAVKLVSLLSFSLFASVLECMSPCLTITTGCSLVCSFEWHMVSWSWPFHSLCLVPGISPMPPSSAGLRVSHLQNAQHEERRQRWYLKPHGVHSSFASSFLVSFSGIPRVHWFGKEGEYNVLVPLHPTTRVPFLMRLLRSWIYSAPLWKISLTSATESSGACQCPQLSVCSHNSVCQLENRPLPGRSAHPTPGVPAQQPLHSPRYQT